MFVIRYRVISIAIAVFMLLSIMGNLAIAATLLSEQEMRSMYGGWLGHYTCDQHNNCEKLGCVERQSGDYAGQLAECNAITVVTCRSDMGFYTLCVLTQSKKQCECCEWWFDGKGEGRCTARGTRDAMNACLCSPP